MVKAEISTQLMIRIESHVGGLAEVTSNLSSHGINMIALCAYEIKNTVAIMFVTEDNNEARSLLEGQGFEVQEDEVILLTLDNKPGSLQFINNRFAEAGINLHLMYGSAHDGAKATRIVLIAENNLDAMMVIQTLIQRT